jgi:excisionase family DNA binding protein
MKSKISEQLSYTEGGASDASGLPRQTICAARKSGELRAMKSGRRWIILREDLLAWLKHCRERGEIPTPISQADRERLAELNRARRQSTA